MPHHVGVREVHDVHVGLVRVDGRGQRGSHVRLAHLRFQIVGGNLGAGDERALLPCFRLLAPAVQEERHVGVLLGLGDVVLRKARLGQHVGQHVGGELLGIGHRSGYLGVVLGQAHEAHLRVRAAIEARERGVHQRARDLAGAVGTEVEEHDRVAVAHAAPGQRRGRDELVGDVRGVGSGHDLGGRRVRARLGGHDGAPRLLDALPPVVAVHGVVASRDAADFGRAALIRQLGEHAFQLVQIARTALRRHVSAVHEAVHHDMRCPGRLRSARERVEVLVGGMDAAVGHEPHEVQRRPRPRGRRERLVQHEVRRQRAVGAGTVDAGELLEHHAPGADVEVSHLGVAHLPRGQAHGLARCLELGPRTGGEHLVEARRARLRDGVSRARLGQAEAVHDDKACGKGKVFG